MLHVESVGRRTYDTDLFRFDDDEHLNVFEFAKLSDKQKPLNDYNFICIINVQMNHFRNKTSKE